MEKFLPADPRYISVVNRAFNKRFRGTPDYVVRATSADDIMHAVNTAVHEKGRVAVTSGGHCLEGFVSDPSVRVLIDVAAMKRIYFDKERRAIAVESGATVGETYRALYENWGTVLPLGEYPGIGMGGHVMGGAFGFLCRQLGLAADYLYGVEMVNVDADGFAYLITATREPDDPNRELWWACTGAGGGNFGIVTRYWFRSHFTTGDEPAELLPKAPESVTTFKVEWNWKDLDAAAFEKLLTNHGAWSEQNSHPDSPNTSLFALLELHRKPFGNIVLRGVSTARVHAEQQFEEYLRAVGNGVVAPAAPVVERMTWLEFALNPLPELFGGPPAGVSMKAKDMLLRTRLTSAQIATAYRYLTDEQYDAAGMLGFATYGGAVNAVSLHATASAQRHATLDAAVNTGWMDSADAEKNLRWARAFYGELFADTGGVPVPGERYDGCLINHPDADLADPSLNTSGVPWYVMYFHDNYARLQHVKLRWDPHDVFHHALSIRLP